MAKTEPSDTDMHFCYRTTHHVWRIVCESPKADYSGFTSGKFNARRIGKKQKKSQKNEMKSLQENTV
jgi:hypothetical protein